MKSKKDYTIALLLLCFSLAAIPGLLLSFDFKGKETAVMIPKNPFYTVTIDGSEKELMYEVYREGFFVGKVYANQLDSLMLVDNQ